MGKLNIPLMPRMPIVPSKNIADSEALPESTMHIFYDKRINDTDDRLMSESHGFTEYRSCDYLCEAYGR